MLGFFEQLLSSDSLAPHGICLLWRPELIWMHVISDALTGLAYFSIPVVLVVFAWRRPDIGFGWVFWCFSAFILACGTTHFFAIWTLWRPDYGAEALIKAATAAASVATAGALWPFLPYALHIPSPKQLRTMNAELERRIAERDEALAKLRQAISDHEQAEEMLRQSQKMEAVGQLASGIAHDFNNLLTVISMNVSRAQRELPDADDKLGRSLSHASLATERAATLTSGLLAFARRQALNPEDVDLNEVVGATVDLVTRSLGGNLTLTCDLDPTPCVVRLDRNQLETALVNLVVNARDAMPDGGAIMVRTRSNMELGPRRRVTVTVTDTGTGMTEEVRQRAAEPFFTTKPVGQGSGLGLSQVYGFVQQSRGFINIESEPGAGTTVTLAFNAAENGARV